MNQSCSPLEQTPLAQKNSSRTRHTGQDQVSPEQPAFPAGGGGMGFSQQLHTALAGGCLTLPSVSQPRKGFTSHRTNHISSEPQAPLKQIQLQPRFSATSSPISNRGSFSSPGHLLSSPSCAQGWPTLPLCTDGQPWCQLTQAPVLLPDANTCIWDRNQMVWLTSLSSQLQNS